MFALFILTSSSAMAFKTYTIPPFKSPPTPSQLSRGCYDKTTHSFYIFGGIDESGSLLNSLSSFDLNSKSWHSYSMLSEEWPQGRKNHMCFVDDDERKLFIFGGENEKIFLNDLWAFSLSSLMWSRVQTSGTTPPPISGFAFTRYIHDNSWKVALTLGQEMRDSFADVYILDVKTLTWTKLLAKGQVPRVNSSAGIVYHSGSLYGLGGYVRATYPQMDLHTDLYKFDLKTSTWSIVQTQNIAYNVCDFGVMVFEGVLYKFFGYNSNDTGNHNLCSKIDLKATNPVWQDVDFVRLNNLTYPMMPIDCFAFDYSGSKAWFVTGWTMIRLRNDVIEADLTSSPVTLTAVTYDFTSPTARKEHKMVNIGESLYMFGGVNEKGYLGDFWKFDTELEKWSYTEVKGTVPSPRAGYSMCTANGNLYLYGGVGNLGLLNDMFVYEYFTNEWSEITTLVMPPARRNACMLCSFPKFYIMGGNTINGLSKEIWELNLQTLTSVVVEPNHSFDFSPFAYANCFGEVLGDDYVIYLGKGETYAQTPIDTISKLSVKHQILNLIETDRPLNKVASFKIGDLYIEAGGEAWGFSSYDNVTMFDISTSSTRNIGSLPQKIYNAAFCYFKSSLYIHGGLISTGNMYLDVSPIDSFYRLEFRENCNDFCDFKCSPGTYYTGSKCALCPVGSYAEDYGSVYCIKCPKGTFSNHLGASSSRQCSPCPHGSYASAEGSSECKTCSAGYDCPVGSTYPSTNFSITEGVTSVQPSLYTSEEGDFGLALTILIGFLGGMAGLAVIFYAADYMDARKFFIKLDLYSKLHNHVINDVMYLRASPIGGLFSMFFIFAAIAFVTLSLISFTITNIVEQKALVPLVSLQEDYKVIDGFVNVTTEFGSYGGSCVKEGTTCDPKIQRTVVGVSGTVEDLACYAFDDSCFVVMFCSDCEIDPEVVISYELTEDNSFAEYIVVNITCSSSIPNEISSVRQTIKPESTKVFRGPQPSELDFEVTSSIFISESAQWPSKETGFHVASIGRASKGSQSYIYELRNTTGLKLILTFKQNSAALMTKRLLKESFLQLFSAVLGSVFGLMSAFGSAMGFIEKHYEILNSKFYRQFAIATKKRSMSYYLRSTKHLSPKLLATKEKACDVTGNSDTVRTSDQMIKLEAVNTRVNSDSF